MISKKLLEISSHVLIKRTVDTVLKKLRVSLRCTGLGQMVDSRMLVQVQHN